jgi:hypothetical protein
MKFVAVTVPQIKRRSVSGRAILSKDEKTGGALMKVILFVHHAYGEATVVVRVFGYPGAVWQIHATGFERFREVQIPFPPLKPLVIGGPSEYHVPVNATLPELL